MKTELKQLFGGSLQIVLPEEFRSMADIVPIPDNQEVFQHMADQCIGQLIIEITEPVLDQNPAQFYFSDLAE